MMAEETATVETKEVPLAESTMAEFKKARNDGKEVATRETITEKEPEKQATEEKPKAKGGFQARIDRLIKQQAETERQLTEERRQREELQAKVSGKDVPKTEQKADAEPKREDFQTEVEYVRALTSWEVKQNMKAAKEAEEKEATAAANKEAIQSYNKRAIEAQSKYEDWKEVMAQDIAIPTIVGDAIIHTIKNGPDVAYFLGTHPEICEEMVSVHPLEAVAMAVKISERLEAEAGKETEESEETTEEEPEAKATEEEKPARKAPAPIKPVSSGTSRSTIPLAKVDYQTYKKLRAQGRVQ